LLFASAMTSPRQVLPGATYLITRRCLQRAFLLRPSRLTNATVGYLLAVASERYGIRLHAFCVLSNHLHLVLTDPKAQLPAFHQYLDSLIARAVNASLGRWETFWAPHSYSAVLLATPSDVVVKAAYVLANPVAAGLVESGSRWPGLWSDPGRIGSQPWVLERPRQFFRQAGCMPATAELRLVAPEGFADAAAFRAALGAELSCQEGRARSEVRAQGRRFLGAARVMSVSPLAAPARAEARRELRPRVAGQDKWRRIEALQRLASFVAAYRSALRAWRRGLDGVVFPAGTYLVRVTHNVPCASAG
jgi:REP element-mobilizing transposase RayT